MILAVGVVAACTLSATLGYGQTPQQYTGFHMPGPAFTPHGLPVYQPSQPIQPAYGYRPVYVPASSYAAQLASHGSEVRATDDPNAIAKLAPEAVQGVEADFASYDGSYDNGGGSCGCADGSCGASNCSGGGCDGWGNRCRAHWFDFHVEALVLERDDNGRSTAFTSQGVNGTRLLTTNSLKLGRPVGFRATASFVFTAGLDVELSYFGTLHWNNSATVTGANNLYSVFSNFGLAGFAPLADADQAFLQSISYSSELDNFEVNFRRRWANPNISLQGSWLLGFRHLNLEEEFLYASFGNTGSMLSQTHTRNELYGFQAGADVWFCLGHCFMIGGEIEAGIYGNTAKTRASVTSTSLNPNVVNEAGSATEAALVAEANLMAVWQATNHFSIRCGVQGLYLDGMALATENFNTASPFNLAAPRTPIFNANGKVFYYGVTAGAEWIW